MTNYLRTFGLLGILTGLLLAIGYYFGGQSGLVFAFGVSVLMNAYSYWFSDRMVLKMYKAQAIEQRDDPKLYNMVSRLSSAAGLPMPKVYKIAMPTPNAFATGRNPKNAAVAVSPSLMQMLSDTELEGVIAHELAHIKNRDILTMSVAATIAGAIAMIAQTGMLVGGPRQRDSQGTAVGALLLLFLSPLLASLLQMAISRTREYKADAIGAKIAGSGMGLAAALEKLHQAVKQRPLMAQPKYEATAHVFIVNPFVPGFVQRLFSTHPPAAERIKRLRQLY